MATTSILALYIKKSIMFMAGQLTSKEEVYEQQARIRRRLNISLN